MNQPGGQAIADWERAVIATAISYPSTMEEAGDLLPSDFTRLNQVVWAELLALHARNGIDTRSVIIALTNCPDWATYAEGMRPEDYLAEVLTARGMNMPHYVERVLDASIRRALRRHAALIAAETEGSDKSARELLDYAEQKLMSLRRDRADQGYSIQDLIGIFIPRLEGQLAGTIRPAWTPSVQGIRDVIDYLEEEDFMTVAARPGEGKSSYMRFEFYQEAKAGRAVGILNYENAPIEYLRYFLGIETGIDTHKMKNPQLLTRAELQQVRDSVEVLSKLKIFVETTARTAPAMLRAARRMAATHEINLLGVDYVQLIHNGSDTRAVDIGVTTGALRQFALDYHVPVIANAQLSRDIEKRGRDADGQVEPELSDLRESGALEQDSTIVMFPRPLRNPSAQVLGLFPENKDASGRLLDRPRALPVTFYIKKNRNGSTGPTDPVLWLKHTGEYRTLERGVMGR